MKTIDFATLSLRDALDLAILVEEEAAERYGELADQMEIHHTPAAGKFFRSMVGNELRHRDTLAARRHQAFSDTSIDVDRSMLWDVEAPEYGSVHAFMTEREALLVALESEEKAFRFFRDAAVHVHDPAARSLLEELCEEELHHQNLVREQLARIPVEENVAEEEDVADEPVAQ